MHSTKNKERQESEKKQTQKIRKQISEGIPRTRIISLMSEREDVDQLRSSHSYLLSLVDSQQKESLRLLALYESDLFKLRQALAASQAECAELRHEMSLIPRSNCLHSSQSLAFNSTFGSSCWETDSPRFSSSSLHVSSPFSRPHAPPPQCEDLLSQHIALDDL